LARAGFTDEDNRIRTTDIPERMQLRTVPVVAAGEDELDEEAEWIYDCAFKKPDTKPQTNTINEDRPGDGFAPSQRQGETSHH
jgi:transcription elongation factor SPT6